MFPTVQIKVCSHLKVCNWLARHVWNSQMSMKFKEAAKVHRLRLVCSPFPPCTHEGKSLLTQSKGFCFWWGFCLVLFVCLSFLLLFFIKIRFYFEKDLNSETGIGWPLSGESSGNEVPISPQKIQFPLDPGALGLQSASSALRSACSAREAGLGNGREPRGKE